MSKVDDRMTFKVKEYIIKDLVGMYTRIGHADADYNLHISLNEGKWLIEVTPESDYGELAMRKIFEAHATEELKKG